MKNLKLNLPISSIAVVACWGAVACSDSSGGNDLSTMASGGGTVDGTGASGTVDGTGGRDPLAGTGGAVGTGGDSTQGTGGDMEASTGGQSASLGATFRVMGRELFDSCGEKVILRGVNEMIVWSPGRDGVPEFSEIAKTGANAVRIVWNEEGSAAELDVAITNAIDAQLIPMVEHHSATGDITLVPDTVDYWTSPDVVAVLKKHESKLLLNIANEAGDTNVSDAVFNSTYQTAITRIRETGLTLPLIIDGTSWGQNIDILQKNGPALIEFDPEKNLMFSVHMWWDDATGTKVIAELQESVDMTLPLIVGEFAQHSVWQCDQNAFAFEVLMAEAQKHQIGWLAWSWGAVDNGDCAGEGSFDMTTGGIFGTWEEPWGEAVAVSDANSIQKTSLRPALMTSGVCAD